MADDDLTREQRTAVVGDTASGAAAEADAGRTIGPYRLLSKLGEGGMGEVWLAEQTDPVRRKVALKVIKRGMDTRNVVARFEAERQALALMDHPCVAKVYDAGSTPRGRPYFVMEYVKGIPINQHCDHHRLTNRQRLELFRRVCEGVQHAHQKAIIHRDLKPSNVLVTIHDDRALPKIIDFGVAKATAQPLTEKTMFTEIGVLIGTPEYMSPEQAGTTGQDVDTRTDVYSLGVILYELIVGALPFESKELREAGYEGLVRRIREDDPSKPSTRLGTLGDRSTESAKFRRTDLLSLKRELAGDLDWIVMKALDKDRVRRYGSPSELAADVGRFLDSRPIEARPPSVAYQLKKAITRHRMPAVFAALVLLLIVGFGIGMAVLYSRALRAEEDARQEAERARLEAETSSQVSEFMVQLFQVSDPSEALGNSITAREILDRGAARIDQELRDDPGVRARLMHAIGNVYDSLGLFEQARPLLEESLAIRERELNPDDPEIEASLNDLSVLYQQLGDFDAALAMQERAVALAETIHGPGHVELATNLNNLGNTYVELGEYDKGMEILGRALAIWETQLGPDHRDLSTALNNLAALHHFSGRYDEARPLYERALAINEKALGPDHPEVITNLNNIGELLVDTGDFEAARPFYERSLATAERVLGPEHPSLAWGLYGSARMHAGFGDYATAEALFERTLQIRETKLGPDHVRVAETLEAWAELLRKQGRVPEAESHEKRAAAIRAKGF